ncbi:MAG TPA: AraC family transcriptional regulator [Candidatus Sulfotelmatobacter sp.]|jgi:AraC family transcriptional regulator|nr:AraC family transcriptional regulator [Candidatus Sulfotelmatobacter sp.]
MLDDREKAYARRFRRVLDYIERHLDEELSVERLSRVAHFSKFHFHRQFAKFCGVSVSRYIQLIRLKTASQQLVRQRQRKIIDIALEAGFENPESFSRAFKQVFGQTPSAFRRCPDWDHWGRQFCFSTPERVDHMDVRIITTPTFKVAVLEHRASPARLTDSVLRFIEWRKNSGLSPVLASKTFGVAYDDPEACEPEAFRFDICGTVAAVVPPNPQGVITKEIPGGRCAVVRHLGSTDRIGESVHYLFRHWLPNSGEALRGFPVYFQYLNVGADVPEAEKETDVFLPLK